MALRMKLTSPMMRSSQRLRYHLGFRPLRLPAPHKATVGALGVLHDLAFAIAQRFHTVGSGGSLLAPLGACARLKLQPSLLHHHEGRARPREILLVSEHSHTIVASLRAVATTAICMPRRARIRRKNERSGPRALAAAHAASTSIARAW